MGDSLGGYPEQVSASNAVPRPASGVAASRAPASSGSGGGSSGGGAGSLPQAPNPGAPAANPNRTQMQAPEIRGASPSSRDRGPSSSRSISSARGDDDGGGE